MPGATMASDSEAQREPDASPSFAPQHQSASRQQSQRPFWSELEPRMPHVPELALGFGGVERKFAGMLDRGEREWIGHLNPDGGLIGWSGRKVGASAPIDQLARQSHLRPYGSAPSPCSTSRRLVTLQNRLDCGSMSGPGQRVRAVGIPPALSSTPPFLFRDHSALLPYRVERGSSEVSDLSRTLVSVRSRLAGVRETSFRTPPHCR